MKWYEKKYFFGWENIKWVILQIGLTLSNQESFFSSKRIERVILFNTAVVSWMIWFYYHFRTITYTEMMATTGMLFIYAGYTMNMTEKEKLKG